VRALLIALSVVAIAAPAPAAADVVDDAVAALDSDSVYVAPGTDALGARDADALRTQINDVGGRIWIAVVPADAGDPRAVLERLVRGLRREGTYAAVVGRSFRAGNTGTFRPGVAPAIADLAFRRNRDAGVAAVLGEFVAEIGKVQAESPAVDSDGDGTSLLVPLLVVGGIGAGAYAISRGRRARRTQLELTAARELTEEDLVALADDVKALDLDVEMPAAAPEAKRHYARAIELYSQANAAWEGARSPEQLQRATTLLEEGRWEMAAAKALLAGEPVPERRPPCFFDPRHGPSSRDVTWSPPWGEARPVPACEADAQRIERGLEPDAREYGGRPYWESPAAGPWAMGYYGAFSGVLPMILLGSMLAGAGGGLFFPGSAHADPGGGGGDFGGGDFGDGDFGSGDFGGDFGGGDFGGGDF
jgi:hypothetical protein